MSIRVTITKPGVVNEYGQALAIGTVYTPNNDDYALALIAQLKATDTDNVLGERINAPFDEVVYPLDPVGLSADGTSLVSGDGTVIEIGGGGGSSTFAGLSDKTSVDIPAINTPTATSLNLKAPLASPTFTGTPAAPTAAKGTNTTQVATTAFVVERTGGASAVVDATDLTLISSHADTNRAPSGAMTYTVNASTGWAVGEGITVWLPTSGTISFAAAGGATLLGGTTTLTRTLAGNSVGYVVLMRIQGTNAYSVTGF